VVASASSWCFADDDGRAFWGGLWADRVVHSAFAEQALSYGLATPDELAAISAAFSDWSRSPDGWFALQHGEVVAHA
jgi:hypothetical protein